MNLNDRDRRALTLLGVSLLLSAIFWYATSTPSAGSIKVVAANPVDSIPRAEKMVTELRKKIATVPGKDAILKKVSSELASREKGLIKGDTAPQAQAQLLQVLREVARNQSPPLAIGQVELGQAQPFGDAYGQVQLSIALDCRIDELVNYLAYLSAQSEIISTDQIRFTGSNPKTKTNQVRLTISGLVPRKLVPEKKAMAAF